MADEKLTQLTAVITASADDIIYIVDDPLGSALSRKITFANFEGALNHVNIASIGTNTHAQIDSAISNSVSHIADTDKHVAHSGVSILAGTGMSGGGTIEASRTLNCSITQYTDALARASISETITGLTYTSATGVLSLTSGYVIPTTTEETNWDAAYTHSQIAGGNSVHVSTTENTNWDAAYAHITTDVMETVADVQAVAVGGDVTGTIGSIQIDHVNIASIGTNTHAQIDTAITASTNHIADNTQAHSDYLLNDAADVGVGLSLTGDNSSADTTYVPNVLYNTDATPPAANTVPIGTIYIQYTA